MLEKHKPKRYRIASEVGQLVVKIDTTAGKTEKVLDKTIAFTNTESRPWSHQTYHLFYGGTYLQTLQESLITALVKLYSS